MKYSVITETYAPAGVYPIATLRSELYLPDKNPSTLRVAFRQYGGMLDHLPRHSKRNPSANRVWLYRRTTTEYIHLTRITEGAQ